MFQAGEQAVDGLAHQRGPTDRRRIGQLIQLGQLTLPHLQAHAHEGILLASLGPRASPPDLRAQWSSRPPPVPFAPLMLSYTPL
jgi:hypothetical protein